MKLLRQMLLPLAAMTMLLLGSCSKDKALLETIPADAGMVISVDINKMAEALGIKVVDGKVVIPEGLHYGKELSAEKLEMLGRAAASLDLERMMIFRSGGHDFVTMTVVQPDSLAATLAGSGCEKHEQNGYTVWVDNGFCIAVRDSQAWIVDADVATTVERIDNVLKAASDAPLAELGVSSYLTGKDPVAVLFNCNTFIPGVKVDRWGAYTARVKDNAIQGTCYSLKPDGSPYDVKGMQRINTPVLQYVPESANIVMAFGLSKEIDWEEQLSGITQALGPMQKAQLEMFLPYLNAIDGTIMMAIGPGHGLDPQQALENRDINFIGMFHMDQEKVNEAVASATSYASQFGTVEKVEEGLYRVPANGMEFYIGNVDGYLTFANFRPNDRNGSAIAGEFTGKKGALSVKFPSARIFHPNADFGFDLSLTSGTDKAEFTFRLTDTDAPILPTLLSL